MSDALSIAASGLGAAAAALNITAQNLANLNTAGYQTRQANFTAQAGGGVSVSSVENDGGSDNAQGNNVDLATQMVSLGQEKILYDANAAVIRVDQQMFGSLLDIFDNASNRG